MSEERTLPGPGSSSDLRAKADQEDVREVRKIATIDGGDIKEGEPFFRLPPWFVRIGRTRCEIDTGFGKVTMKTVAIEEDTLLNFAQGNAKACKQMLRGILKIPEDWEAEQDVLLGRGHSVREGEVIPDPQEIAQMAPPVCSTYVAEFFPRSLITQIVTAYQFMVMPPIAYTETDSD